MTYANTEDIENRSRRDLSDDELTICESLLEDAAVIVDAYNKDAPEDAKKLVSCNMIIRLLGDGQDNQFPIGSTQGTMSALGYSQTFTMGSGSTGELYLTKMDKKLLRVGKRIGFAQTLVVAEASDD